ALVIGAAGPTPEAVRGERGEPDHAHVGVLQGDAYVLGIGAVAQPCPAVDLHAPLQVALLDHVVDVLLHQVGGVGAHVPVVFEGDGPHAGLRGVDGHVDHGLSAMDEVGISVDV